jgi:hypothetical protein
MATFNTFSVTTKDLSMYLNSQGSLFENAESELDSKAKPYYPPSQTLPTSSIPELLVPTLNEYASKPPLPRNRELCNFDDNCTKSSCTRIHPQEWYKLSSHFSRIEEENRKEYNNIVNFKLHMYPSLNSLYMQIADIHIKIADNARSDAQRNITDNSHLTLNLRVNLISVDHKHHRNTHRNSSDGSTTASASGAASGGGGGANYRNNYRKEYLDEKPKSKTAPGPAPYTSEPYSASNFNSTSASGDRSGGGGAAGGARLRQDRPPRGLYKNTNVDTLGGATIIGSHVGSDEAYVYKDRSDIFGSSKGRKDTPLLMNVGEEKEVYYPKTPATVSNNWRN